MHVLVIENEKKVAEALRKGLEAEEYRLQKLSIALPFLRKRKSRLSLMRSPDPSLLRLTRHHPSSRSQHHRLRDTHSTYEVGEGSSTSEGRTKKIGRHR
jgi:hypothetical protein